MARCRAGPVRCAGCCRRERFLLPRLHEQIANLPRELKFATDLQERILRNRGRAVQAAMSKASRAATAVFRLVELGAIGALALALLPRPDWMPVPAAIESWPTVVVVVLGGIAFLFARTMRRFVKLPDVKP